MAGAGLLAGQGTPPQSASAPAKTPPPPKKQGKITTLFKSPEGFPNAIAESKDGLWVGDQKTDHACLVSWDDGKLLKTVKTESKNTSGMGFGAGYLWMGANAAPEGIFQTDLNSRTISHHQIPLGGGGCHGVLYAEGKVWIAALRLRGILRVDPKTWDPEYLIPYAVPRAHGVAWDNGTIWMVTGTNSESGPQSGLVHYDASNGKVIETVEFAERYPDPHGLAIKNGVLYTSDAGLHPGWPDLISPASGYICRIEIS
jgi:hypothetical protein